MYRTIPMWIFIIITFVWENKQPVNHNSALMEYLIQSGVEGTTESHIKIQRTEKCQGYLNSDIRDK